MQSKDSKNCHPLSTISEEPDARNSLSSQNSEKLESTSSCRLSSLDNGRPDSCQGGVFIPDLDDHKKLKERKACKDYISVQKFMSSSYRPKYKKRSKWDSPDYQRKRQKIDDLPVSKLNSMFKSNDILSASWQKMRHDSKKIVLEARIKNFIVDLSKDFGNFGKGFTGHKGNFKFSDYPSIDVEMKDKLSDYIWNLGLRAFFREITSPPDPIHEKPIKTEKEQNHAPNYQMLAAKNLCTVATGLNTPSEV